MSASAEARCEFCGEFRWCSNVHAAQHWLTDIHWPVCEVKRSPMDCLYCNERFTDFAALATHVVTQHNPQGYGDRSKEMENAMARQSLPQAQGNGNVQGPRKGALPEPEGGNFSPFLKAEHLGKAGTGKIKVYEVRDAPPNSFSDIVVAVKLDGTSYDWGMKFSSGNYRRLVTRFGTNPDKWQGTVNVKVAEYAGKQYVAVDD